MRTATETIANTKLVPVLKTLTAISVIIGTLAFYNKDIHATNPFTTSKVCETIEKRSTQLVDLRFKYTVTTNLIDSTVQGTQKEDDRTMRSREEIFSILKSKSDTHPMPWISWLVHSEKEGQTPLASFFVYDGKNSYRFLRGEPRGPNGSPRNFGLIEPGYDNTFLIENYFERILFLKINASSLNLDSIKRSDSSNEYRFIKETVYLGRKALEFERVRVPGKIVNIATVLLEPCYMVVSYKTISIPTNTILAELKVDELHLFEGVVYPSRGRYSELESKRSYTFQVTSVERLTDHVRSHWLPPWPEDTDVQDVVNRE